LLGTRRHPGHARTVFRRALVHESLLVAEATATAIARISLAEALLVAMAAECREARRNADAPGHGADVLEPPARAIYSDAAGV
jgi:hypothetical protein